MDSNRKHYQILDLEVRGMKKNISLYQWTIIILSLIVVMMTLLQLTLNLTPKLNQIFNVLDILIWLFFLIDYIVRLSHSSSKREFILHNKLEILTIIPFYSFFRLFRLVRVAEIVPLLRFTKVLRATVMLSTFSKHIGRFIRTNNLHYVVVCTIIVVLLGAGGISLTEGIEFTDALWWSIVTVTTIGYGDIVPTTAIGRIIATLIMLTGIGFLGALTGTISTYFLNRRPDVYRPKIVEEMIEKLNHFDELSLEELQLIISVLELIKKSQNDPSQTSQQTLKENETKN